MSNASTGCTENDTSRIIQRSPRCASPTFVRPGAHGSWTLHSRWYGWLYLQANRSTAAWRCPERLQFQPSPGPSQPDV